MIKVVLGSIILALTAASVRAEMVFYDDFSAYASQTELNDAYNIDLGPQGDVSLLGSRESAELKLLRPYNGIPELTRIGTDHAFQSSKNVFKVSFDIQLNQICAPYALGFSLHGYSAPYTHSLLDDETFLGENLTLGAGLLETVEVVINNTDQTQQLNEFDALDAGLYNIYMDGQRIVSGGNFAAPIDGEWLDFDFFTAGMVDAKLDNFAIENLDEYVVPIPEPTTFSLIAIAGGSMVIIQRRQKRKRVMGA